MPEFVLELHSLRDTSFTTSNHANPILLRVAAIKYCETTVGTLLWFLFLRLIFPGFSSIPQNLVLRRFLLIAFLLPFSSFYPPFSWFDGFWLLFLKLLCKKLDITSFLPVSARKLICILGALISILTHFALTKDSFVWKIIHKKLRNL